MMLVERHNDLMRSGRQATLLRWLGELPPARIVENPILAPVGALASGLLGRQAEERRRFLALATRARDERSDDWTPLHEAGLGLALTISVNGDVGEAVAAARVTADIGRSIDEIAVPALASLAFLLFLAGDHSESRLIAREALNRPELLARPHGHVYALATMALVDVELGVGDAEAKARQALAAASAAGVAETGSGGLARLALAAALAASGRLAKAEREAVHAERLRRQSEPDASHLYAMLLLIEIRARRGQLSRAAGDLERAKAELEGFSDPGGLSDLAARVERTIDDTRLSPGELKEEPTVAELNVLRLLAGDLSQRQIGSQLYLSVNTVKTHTRTLYRKLGVTSREAAVARAVALGLLDVDDSPG
jgi:LuxR family maltose regulon positive regulatory protein